MTTHQAAWLVVPALPVALWIAFSDLRDMRITNRAVLAMALVFAVAGFFALPFSAWLWQLGQMAIALALGFVAHGLRMMGGGDAKYAAAIAGFVLPGDILRVLVIFATMLLAAFTVHRVFRALPPVRRLTPGWKSWESGSLFPMGLALSGTLIAYLVGALFTGSPA